MNKLISTKNRVFVSLVGPSETRKLQLFYNWLKVRTFEPNSDKVYHFYQHSQPLRYYAEGNWKSRVCEWNKLWIYWFVEKQRYKIFVNFWRLLWKDLQFKCFVDIATAARRRGLSTIYIKHNLFHQSKLRRDVELQSTHLVLFKSPRDVMQVTTLSTQLCLGSKLVDWYQDATSVPIGHFLIDLLPRTEDRLRYCTNTGSIPSKCYIPDRLKKSKNLDDEHKKVPYSPSVPIIFPQRQK